MSIEGLIGSGLIVLVSLFVIVLPFIWHGSETDEEVLAARKYRDELLSQYHLVLETVRDMDADYQMGKMPEDDYSYERVQWVERGVVLLQALDSLSGADAVTARERAAIQGVRDDAQINDEIEAAVARYLKTAEAG